MTAVTLPAVTPFTAGNPLLLALAGANFAVGLAAFGVVGTLAPLAGSLGISPATAGWLLTAYALVYAIGSPLLVAATGATDRRRLLLVGLVVIALGNTLAAVAPDYATILAGRVLTAFGAAVVTPVAAAIAVAGSAPEGRGRALGLVFGGFTLAQAFGVPLGSWLAYGFGWRTAFEVTAAVALLAAVPLATILPRGLPRGGSSLSALGGVLRQGRLVLGIGFTALFMGAAFIPYTYLGPLLHERAGLDAAGISLAFLVFGLGGVAGNALGSALLPRLGADRTLLILCLVAMALPPALTLGAWSAPTAMALVFVWSLFCFAFMVPQEARVAALAPAAAPVMLALNASAIYLGTSLGATAGGLVHGSLGAAWLGPVSVLFALLALTSVLALRPRT